MVEDCFQIILIVIVEIDIEIYRILHISIWIWESCWHPRWL